MSAIKLDGITLASTANSAITIDNVTLGGDVAMASSGLTVRNVELFALASDQTNTSNTLTTFFTVNYTPKFSGSKVQGVLRLLGECANNGTYDNRARLQILTSGNGITNVTGKDQYIGSYDYGGSGHILGWHFNTSTPLVTTSSTDVITLTFKLANSTTAGSPSWSAFGDGTMAETFCTVFEYK